MQNGSLSSGRTPAGPRQRPAGEQKGRRDRALDLFIDMSYRGLDEDFIEGRQYRDLIILLRAAPRVRQEALELDLDELNPVARIDPEGEGVATPAFEVVDASFAERIRADLDERLRTRWSNRHRILTIGDSDAPTSE